MISEMIMAALIAAIAAVESHNNSNLTGLNGECGAFQITQMYLDDANRFMGTKYTLHDMMDMEIAEKVVRSYLKHYGHIYEMNTGKPVTADVLARIHNGGPYGYLRHCTMEYWEKVKAAMEENENGI